MPDDPAPPSESAPPSERVSAEALRTYLSSPDVVAHVRSMVKRKVPRQDVDDVTGEAIVKMCATGARPRNEAAIGGWVEVSTVHAIADHLRGKGRRGARETAVEDIDEHAASSPGPTVELTEWLRQRVKKSRIDAETLAMIEQQGREGLTRAEIAAHHGMSEETYKKRVQRMKQKYEEQWRRERALLVLALLLAVAVVAAIGWWAVARARHEARPPEIAPEPVPSASVAPPAPPPDDRRNVAAPPDASSPDDKRRAPPP